MNPYLAMSAIFALGFRGIEKKLALKYGPLGTPGATRAEIPHLATSLQAAVVDFAAPKSIAREVLGDYFVDHFAGTRQHEIEEHCKAVTNWEGESWTKCMSQAGTDDSWTLSRVDLDPG